MRKVMPKRTDLKNICILGSGPVVIGQAAEFDYAGTQAVKALKQDGYKILLINSNPASIMTHSRLAHKTYIEPLTVEYVHKILSKERPCAILPTVGGQTALNLALELNQEGILKKLGIELIGADIEAIERAENRDLFKKTMTQAGLPVLRSLVCHNEQEALLAIQEFGLPIIVRPSFTLGGSGGGIANNKNEFLELVRFGLQTSPSHQVLLEESVIGHKEYEFEVIRDEADNALVVCSIENFDPMGVHTGDSITIAPQQTLSDAEYQILRSASLKVLRAIGVKTGGSNVQFSVNPNNGQFSVIEMNPRVSRSSALASKATGYPIAKVAAKLAVGYRLDEIVNDITKKTTAAFEPALDYVVVKIPKFAFEKFTSEDPILTTQMRSVGEVMGIGRSFKEALHKAMVSLEENCLGFENAFLKPDLEKNKSIKEYLKKPTPKRLWRIAEAFLCGLTIDDVAEASNIDRWFLGQIKDIIELEQKLSKMSLTTLEKKDFLELKIAGFLDARIGKLVGADALDVTKARLKAGVKPIFKRIDTCAGEFEALTPYLYSTYEEPSFKLINDELIEITACEAKPSDRRKIVVLGSGPIRIGQGIEFDCCASESIPAIQGLGFEAIMINCNPETVSTDFDIADRLYFEPLTFEHVMNVLDMEKAFGVIVQLGGQTPLSLARLLHEAGVNILGTSPNDIDRAEDRKRSRELFDELGLRQPPSYTVAAMEEAFISAESLGYPLMVRPSYVLGGRAMERVFNQMELKKCMERAWIAVPHKPILIDHFLDGAIECDVDVLSDGESTYVAGILQHIEEAGIHSGDSVCVLPPYDLSLTLIKKLDHASRILARELKIRGLLNIQFAIKDEEIFIIEVNPRASRTVPFISKFTNVPLAELAATIMCQEKLPCSLRGKNYFDFMPKDLFAIKAPVMPFLKFLKSDPLLGPEMRSTGEVMAIADCFEQAFLKSLHAVGSNLPTKGGLFVSVADRDKDALLPAVRMMADYGFTIIATSGTHCFLKAHNIDSQRVNKVREGTPHVLDLIDKKEITIMFNTVLGAASVHDSHLFRKKALINGIPYFTSVSAAHTLAKVMVKRINENALFIKSLQEIHQQKELNPHGNL
jgi:carbamoyl-phosphate synthase large subunit